MPRAPTQPRTKRTPKTFHAHPRHTLEARQSPRWRRTSCCRHLRLHLRLPPRQQRLIRHQSPLLRQRQPPRRQHRVPGRHPHLSSPARRVLSMTRTRSCSGRRARRENELPKPTESKSTRRHGRGRGLAREPARGPAKVERGRIFGVARCRGHTFALGEALSACLTPSRTPAPTARAGVPSRGQPVALSARGHAPRASG